MKLALYSLITILGSSPFVFANWQGLSVWKSNQIVENSISGKVKTIAINEESDQLIVKVMKADGSIEVAKVCHEGIQSSRNQIHGSPKLALLQSAMSSGSLVSLAHSSRFDHCIDEVQVQSAHPSKGVKKAAAQGEGFHDI